jgi:hypothetical protein
MGFENIEWKDGEEKFEGLKVCALTDKIERPKWYESVKKFCDRGYDLCVVGNSVTAWLRGTEDYKTITIFMEKPDDIEKFIKDATCCFKCEMLVRDTNIQAYPCKEVSCVIYFLFNDGFEAVHNFPTSVWNVGIHFASGTLMATGEAIEDIKNKCFHYPFIFGLNPESYTDFILSFDQDNLNQKIFKNNVDNLMIHDGLHTGANYVNSCKRYNLKAIASFYVTEKLFNELLFIIKMKKKHEDVIKKIQEFNKKKNDEKKKIRSYVNGCLAGDRFEHVLNDIICKRIVTADGSGHIKVGDNTTCDLIELAKTMKTSPDREVLNCICDAACKGEIETGDGASSSTVNCELLTVNGNNNTEVVAALKNAAEALRALAEKIGK